MPDGTTQKKKLTRVDILDKAIKKLEMRNYHETCLKAEICPNCGGKLVVYRSVNLLCLDCARLWLK